jgi:long-subunit acyl-CoA synthetase (AMP-forming)
MYPEDIIYGTVGHPLPGIEIKLGFFLFRKYLCSFVLYEVSIPSLNFSVETDPPKGEICVRSGGVFLGYYDHSDGFLYWINLKCNKNKRN